MAVAIFAGEESFKPTDLWMCPAFFLMGAFSFWLQTGVIDLHPDCVVLRQRFRRPVEISLRDLVSVQPNRYGLYFRTGEREGKQGPDLIGHKGLGLQVMKVEIRGDRIASRIMEAAESARHN